MTSGVKPPLPPLWTCPRCGAKFVTRNMSHGCGDYSIDEFLDGVGAPGRALFDRFVELVSRNGPVEIVPTKTRVAFMVRVRFATVTTVSDRGMTFTINLMRKLDNARIARIDQYDKWFVHRMRVTTLEELDTDVSAWLTESYQLGGQSYLNP